MGWSLSLACRNSNDGGYHVRISGVRIVLARSDRPFDPRALFDESGRWRFAVHRSGSGSACAVPRGLSEHKASEAALPPVALAAEACASAEGGVGGPDDCVLLMSRSSLAPPQPHGISFQGLSLFALIAESVSYYTNQKLRTWVPVL